ncbi:hypothetical protein [Taibaiella koreensis]|uniref:hypothetical protein n=1 Tax=Taibaiella koreensis TaxID=1268548 RepID=UPI0013C2D94E|nr:hypothetical protein [Taibaiella koreensis]
MRAESKKELPAMETGEMEQQPFLMCARLCEFKKCCKKYKEGRRCKKCPKKH